MGLVDDDGMEFPNEAVVLRQSADPPDDRAVLSQRNAADFLRAD